MSLKPGESVTVVHGLPPTGSERATVVADHGRLVEVQFAGGGRLSVQRSLLVLLAPTGRHTNRAGDMATAVAAGLATGEQLGSTQWAVLDALCRAGERGLIDAEHEAINQLRPDSAGKRRLELAEWGLVEDTATKRKTPRGRWAQVWRATALGIDIWQREGRRRGAA